MTAFENDTMEQTVVKKIYWETSIEWCGQTMLCFKDGGKMKEEIVNLFGCCVQRWHKKTEVVKNLVNWRDAVHCSMCDEKRL